MNIMNVKNINGLESEIWISYSRINESGNNFMDNLYNYGLLMFDN